MSFVNKGNNLYINSTAHVVAIIGKLFKKNLGTSIIDI